MSRKSALVLARLEKHGLLLQTDPNLPNVCALVGERAVVRILVGASSPGPVAGRDGHPAAVGNPGRLQGLSCEARKLLTQVNRKPVQADGRVSKTASELETNLLVHVEQFHTASGAHARRLESWDHWSGRTGYVGERITVARAKLALDDLSRRSTESSRAVGVCRGIGFAQQLPDDGAREV